MVISTMVIPTMDHIDTVFTSSVVNSQVLEGPIQTALHLAKKTLNRYYSLTDMSETYHIAMGTFCVSFFLYYLFSYHLVVLHPCHKLEYFKAARWEDEWIATAHSIVHNTYEHLYASHSTTGA
jgi:hypothetical protein